MTTSKDPMTDDTIDPPRDVKAAVRHAREEHERGIYRAAAREVRGNVTHLARRLGMSRKGAQLRIAALGLREEIEGMRAARGAGHCPRCGHTIEAQS